MDPDEPTSLIPDDFEPEPVPVQFSPPDQDFAPDLALRRAEYANLDRRFAVVAAADREHAREFDEEYLSELRVWARAISDEELAALAVPDDGAEPARNESAGDEFADVIAALKEGRGVPDEVTFALQIRSIGAVTAAVWVIDPPIRDGCRHVYPGGSSVRVSIDRAQQKYNNGRVIVVRPGRANFAVPPTDTVAATNGCVVRGNAVGGAVWSCYHIHGAGTMKAGS